MAQTTGLDAALALDAIYYSAPIPRNMAVLTIMGAVFDKVYFPQRLHAEKRLRRG
jgi:hypothetical protein